MLRRTLGAAPARGQSAGPPGSVTVPRWFTEIRQLPASPDLIRLKAVSPEIQSLGVVERLFAQIVSGEKTSTIRWREQHVVAGPLRFVCRGDGSRTVVVTVTRCTEMPLSQAASFVGRSDEWPDQIMLAGMREHYPEIELSSTVQVVEYEPPPSA